MNLSQTSDRFALTDINDLHIEPALLPFMAIQKADLYRQKHFLPQVPETVIVNTHGEFAINIHEGVSLAKLIFLMKKLHTTDKTPLQIETPLITLDLYTRASQMTQRLRFYFQNGELLSTRNILADTSPRTPVVWKYDGYEVPTRSEYLFVVRSDTDKLNKKSRFAQIREYTQKFFAEREHIDAVVLKKVYRGNFGENKMWDHRRAIYQKENRTYNATAEKKLIGMGPYITVQIQEVRKMILPALIDSFRMLPLIDALFLNQLKPFACFKKLAGKTADISPELKVEIECKGVKNRREGAYLAQQLTDSQGLLTKTGIGFKIALERKIGSVN